MSQQTINWVETNHAEGRYAKILSAVYGSIWAIMPDKLEAILALLEFRASGGRYTPEEIQARIGNQKPQQVVDGSIAVLNLHGVIAHRMNEEMQASGGGVSAKRFGNEFDAAIANDKIGAIVLSIDSPGGSVSGIPELAAKIRMARGTKPIVAVADSLAASAAYWIASAANQIVASPSADLGSIGVMAIHTDESERNGRLGIKHTLITSAPFKAEATDIAPLSEDARLNMQTRVDDYHKMFVGAIADGRGTTAEKVDATFGKGRVIGAEQAVKVGMADRVATFEDVINELAGTKKKRSVKSMAAMRRGMEALT